MGVHSVDEFPSRYEIQVAEADVELARTLLADVEP